MKMTNFNKINFNESNEINVNLKLLHTIYFIQSPSRKEEKMREFIKSHLRTLKGVSFTQDKSGNLLVTKGELKSDEYYPCLVAHMDEVHDENKDRLICQTGDFIYAWDNKYGKRDGLGADDKNGIYILLELIERLDKVKAFFSVQEEVGYIGSNLVDLTFFNNVGYLIQPDRRGNSDLITNTNGGIVTSDDFLFDILEICEDYGYYEANGIGTDIGKLKNRGVNVSACNVSCGYWDEHTEDELTHVPSLENAMNFIYKIVKSLGCKEYPHTIVRNTVVRNSKSSNYQWDRFDWGDQFAWDGEFDSEDEYESDYSKNYKQDYSNYYDNYSSNLPCDNCAGNCWDCKVFK